jgi:hypothetical protein
MMGQEVILHGWQLVWFAFANQAFMLIAVLFLMWVDRQIGSWCGCVGLWKHFWAWWRQPVGSASNPPYVERRRWSTTPGRRRGCERTDHPQSYEEFKKDYDKFEIPNA